MKIGLVLAALLSFFSQVQSKAVFAHFMVGNSGSFNIQEWKNNILLAQEAGIDAFALNIAVGDDPNYPQLSNAFSAANELGGAFKLFFSFDYPGGKSPWTKEEVSDLIRIYGPNGSYFKRGTQPLVSTFEGIDNALDWIAIKKETGCFFLPDWSSRGAKVALQLNPGVANGLFNWGAWPDGSTEMSLKVDSSYTYFLGQAGLSTYMMPASPWFYTNLPGYCKNWLWRGDDLWHIRWFQIWNTQPEYVEIISWNDYGESHYIGPLYENELGAFAPAKGNAPINYATGMKHDGWRELLPFVINTYKNNITTITQERLVIWYRKHPRFSCTSGGTTANSASQAQTEYNPSGVVYDSVFFSILLGSAADVITVTIGGTSKQVLITDIPVGGVGIYHGSAPFGDSLGAVEMKVTRGGREILKVNGGPIITTVCDKNIQNWNAWVGSARSADTISATPPYRLEQLVCIAGKGEGDLNPLCIISCQYGYCPQGVCTCTKMGGQGLAPTYKVPTVYGCPAPGRTSSYLGLCAFSCNLATGGYCDSSVCVTYSQPTTCTVAADPPDPPASTAPPPESCVNPNNVCVEGTGPGNFVGLCVYSCQYGHCPSPCTCSRTGVQVTPPAQIAVTSCPAHDIDANDYDKYKDLCEFTCSRNYCPDGACVSYANSDSTVPALPCKPAGVQKGAFSGSQFTYFDQRVKSYGWEKISPAVVHIPVWMFSSPNTNILDPCYPESAITLANYPGCLSTSTCQKNPGTNVPPSINPGEDCTNPSGGSYNGAYTRGDPFPVYVGTSYCGDKDEWRMNFNLYYVHDGVSSIGHVHDWDSGLTIVFNRAPGANGGDWWYRESAIYSKHAWQNRFTWDQVQTVDGLDDVKTEQVNLNKPHPKIYVGFITHAAFWEPCDTCRQTQAASDSETIANAEYRSNDWYYMPQVTDSWHDFHLWSEIQPSWDYGHATGTPLVRHGTTGEGMCFFKETIGSGGESGCDDQGICSA